MQTQETTSISAQSDADTNSGKQAWLTVLTPWRKATLIALPTFLVTRLLMIILTYFGGVLFNVQSNSSFPLTFQSILYYWYQWDAPRNLSIAAQGYTNPAYTTLFPLYPAIVHLVSALLHLDTLLTGMIISNLALFGAMIIIYRLVENEFDAGTAKRCMLYIAIFPTALFFFTAYNTALLLFLTITTIYLLRQGSWWLAGCFGGLAALTDLSGSLLFIVFLCEFVRQQGPILRQSPAMKSNLQRRAASSVAEADTQQADTSEPETINVSGGFTQTIEGQAEQRARVMLVIPLLASILIPLGLMIYALSLSKPFQDPFIFLHPVTTNQPGLFGGLITAFHTLSSGSWDTFAATHSIFELLLLLGMIALIVAGFKGRERLAPTQWPLLVFGVLIIIYALLFPNQLGVAFNQYDPLPSMQYAALLFIPGFIILARMGRYPWVHQTYLLFSTPLLAFLVIQMFKMLWAM